MKTKEKANENSFLLAVAEKGKLDCTRRWLCGSILGKAEVRVRSDDMAPAQVQFASLSVLSSTWQYYSYQMSNILFLLVSPTAAGAAVLVFDGNALTSMTHFTFRCLR